MTNFSLGYGSHTHTYSYKNIRRYSSDFIKTKFQSITSQHWLRRENRIIRTSILNSFSLLRKRNRKWKTFLHFIVTYKHKHIWTLKNECVQSKVSGKLLRQLVVGSTSKNAVQPWLVWLSGLSASLWTKGLQVRLPDQVTCLGCGLVPSTGLMRSNHTLMFLSVSFSFPSPLSKNK